MAPLRYRLPESLALGLSPVSVRALRPLLAWIGSSPFARLRVPIRWIAPMKAIANQPGLRRLCVSDARGGGGLVPLGFLASFLFSIPEVEPEGFRRIPVTLIHPTEDHWTPPAMSLAFLQRIAAETLHVPLVGCGHFPMEEPGLTTLEQTLRDTLVEVVRSMHGK